MHVLLKTCFTAEQLTSESDAFKLDINLVCANGGGRMKILEFTVSGLNQGKHSHHIKFNDDITVLVGRNGSGKTTILKLVWFMVSGNLERISTEMSFKFANLKTDRYEIDYEMIEEHDSPSKNLEERLARRSVNNKRFVINIKTEKHEDGVRFDSINSKIDIDELNKLIASAGSSIFFPTFRRFEGGYTIDQMSMDSTPRSRYNRRNKFDAMAIEISEMLSVMNHKFVVSFSVSDISLLLQQRYAQAAHHYQESQKGIGSEVIQEIRRFRLLGRSSDNNSAIKLIASIENQIKNMEEERGKFMMPIFSLEDHIRKMLKKDIGMLPGASSFNSKRKDLDLDDLSAGEKQMISFLCYNSLNDDMPFFIDEPELSLNGDWQRQLFSTLIRQNPSNQFIISTHSPFIYANLKDKMYNVNENGDKGD